MFLAFYVAYVAYLILGAQQHDAVDEFSAVMLSFVLRSPSSRWSRW